MIAENVFELNRNQNIDYTMPIKDDDKNLLFDKHTANLFAENGKNKRDKSPSTCHNNADTSNETTDTSRINATDNGKRPKTVCYDFKKGICRRRFCRYPHVMNTDQVVFCHDFQNNGCFRHNCRFIHRSIEDEDHYQIYGVFPIPTERPQTNVMSQPEHHVAQPVHAPPPSHMNYYSNCDNMIANQPPQSNQTAQAFPQNSTMPMISRRRSFGMADSNIEPMIPQKRPHLEEIRTAAVTTVTYNGQNNDNSHQCRYVEPNIGQTMNGIPTTVPNSVAQVQPPHVSAPAVTSVVISEDVINIYRLYEEHNLLRRRVEINEERLQELRATNTYLLQQNEQLRRQIQCSCANTIVNPVTLTTASQPTATPVLNAVSIAPVQVQATPIVSIASIGQPQTQIIASSTPLAIAANTTQGQQLALASTQQAGQILGTPQITLATAPSMGITMNTSQSLAMSANATQPIISYPVMTHSILPH